MKILVLNGPNLNFLGIREPAIYGSQTYDNLIAKINAHCEEKGIEVQCLQSNHEGTLIDYIQQAYFDKVDGIVINPAAYTHTSVAILDVLKAHNAPAAFFLVGNYIEKNAEPVIEEILKDYPHRVLHNPTKRFLSQAYQGLLRRGANPH